MHIDVMSWGMHFTHFRSDATWKGRLYNLESWMVANPNLLHPLFTYIKLSLHHIDVDEVHVMHLGTATYMIGSILWVLCYEIMGGLPKDNVAEVWSLVRQEYRVNGTACQFTNLTLSSFCDPAQPRAHYPKMKGIWG